MIPDVEIIWRAFELRPAPTPLPDATSDFFTGMWERSIYPFAKKLDRTMKMPLFKPRSRLAHEAAKWSAMHGGFEGYSESLFRAYFEYGRDISDAKVLLSIASDLGNDVESLRVSIENRDFRDTVIEEENQAIEIGLNVVPAFVANKRSGMTGVQTVDNLTKLIESVREL
jgi:predicted DsbA family dithiol-disulfide isomerase